MQQVWWIWASGALAALILEACAGGSFIFVFFALGAAVTAMLVGFDVLTAVWQAAACFFAVTAMSLIACRPRLRDWRHSNQALGDMAGLTGSLVVVEVAINPQGVGQVNHRGTLWMARNTGPDLLPVGAACRVVRVDNLTLWVHTSAEEAQ